MTVTLIFNASRMLRPAAAALVITVNSIVQTSTSNYTVTASSDYEPPVVASFYWQTRSNLTDRWSTVEMVPFTFAAHAYTNTINTTDRFFRLSGNLLGSGCCP